MLPVLFRIPGLNIPVPGYGFMLMLGFLLGIMWAVRRGMKSGADPDVILNCGFIALIAGVIGCRVMYVVHYWDKFTVYEDMGRRIFAIIDVRQGGLEFYGGFILTALCILIYLRFWGHSVRWYLDIMAPSAALGLAFGRVGCFLNGCCWGAVCTMPWAVQFPYGSNAQYIQFVDKAPGATLPPELTVSIGGKQPAVIPLADFSADEAKLAAARKADNDAVEKCVALKRRIDASLDEAALTTMTTRYKNMLKGLATGNTRYLAMRHQIARHGVTLDQIKTMAKEYWSLPVHPTQLYSSINALLIALLLNAWYWRRTRDGQVVCLLFAIQPVTRWLLEVIRADNPHDTLGGFTISQGIAIGMLIVSVTCMIFLRKLPPRSRRAKIWDPEEDDKPASAKQSSKKKKAARA